MRLATVLRSLLAPLAGLLILAFPFQGLGQWAIDPDFGEQGQFAFGTDTITIAEAWLRLPGDSVLVLSSTGPANASVIDRDLLLMKLGPEGELDLDFGNGGHLRFDFAGLDYSTGSDLVEDADGSFLVLGSGYRFDSSQHVLGMVARVSRTGAVKAVTQTQFQVPLESIGFKEYPNGLAPLPGGGFMVVGSSLDPNGWHSQPIVSCLDAEFLPDSSFAGTGKLLFDLDGGQALRNSEALHFSGGYFKDLEVLPDGRVTVVGGISNGIHLEGLLVQFRLDGSLDPVFNGGTGYARFDWGNGYDTRLTHLSHLPDGTVLLGGSLGADAPARGMFLGRFNPLNGSHVHETLEVGGDGELTDMVWAADQQAVLAVGTARTDSGRNLVMAWVPNVEQMEVHETLHLYPGNQGFSEGKLGMVQSTGRVLLGGSVRKTALRSGGLVMGIGSGYVEVEELEENQDFIVFGPNPVSERLTISSSAFMHSIGIWNAAGQQVVAAQPGRRRTYGINMDCLPSGIYFIKVNEGFARRLVVQHQ